MGEEESGRKRTLVQRIFRFSLIAIPLFLYGRYVYHTFRPCPKIKSYESGYRYACSKSSYSLRQKVLKTLIAKCCKHVKTERSYNFDAAKRMAQKREDPCDRYDTSGRAERTKRYSCKSEPFEIYGSERKQGETDAECGEQHKKKRGRKKRPKTDPCKTLYDQKTVDDPCISRTDKTQTESNQLANVQHIREPNVAKECMNPPKDGLPDDSTPINIPPEVLDRLCKSYHETYQRIAQTFDQKNDKISSGKTDVEACDKNFHSEDPDTPYIVKNYTCKEENKESGDSVKEPDPCDGVDE
ncbi:unnamed protein product, partial [Nesidiocoris tenuis]